MNFDYSVMRESKGYKTLRPLAKAVIASRFKIKCVGSENIPKEGSFILCCNHMFILDPVIIISHCPRTLHFMAKHEAFKNPLFAAFLKRMNVFPVKRGYRDRAALDYAERVIKNGWCFGIFPEGARSKDYLPKSAKTGIAYLALRTGADILPVSLYRDPNEKGLRTRLTLRFGEIIKNQSLGLGEEYSQAKIKNASKLIMNRIVELWQMGHEE